METLSVPLSARSASLWRDTICPKEHGSWSLAFEPIALGLLVAPSVPGAFFGLALAAGFFARRPLRMAVLERREPRRQAAYRALAICGSAALTAFAAVLLLRGVSWLIYLVPTLIAGAAFAWFDARGDGREEIAELTGAAAFALTPMTLAILGGWSAASAVALGLLMMGRSVPSVAFVRAFLRATKTGTRRDAPALIASGLALAAAAWFFARGLAPLFAVVMLAGFAVRAAVVLVLLRPAWRARTVGMAEAVLGLLFVAGLALSWA